MCTTRSKPSHCSRCDVALYRLAIGEVTGRDVRCTATYEHVRGCTGMYGDVRVCTRCQGALMYTHKYHTHAGRHALHAFSRRQPERLHPENPSTITSCRSITAPISRLFSETGKTQPAAVQHRASECSNFGETNSTAMWGGGGRVKGIGDVCRVRAGYGQGKDRGTGQW